MLGPNEAKVNRVLVSGPTNRLSTCFQVREHAAFVVLALGHLVNLPINRADE